MPRATTRVNADDYPVLSRYFAGDAQAVVDLWEKYRALYYRMYYKWGGRETLGRVHTLEDFIQDMYFEIRSLLEWCNPQMVKPGYTLLSLVTQRCSKVLDRYHSFEDPRGQALLDAPVHTDKEDGTTRRDVIPGCYRSTWPVWVSAVDRWSSGLPRTSRATVQLTIRGYSQRDIARETGVSKQRVSQIFNKVRPEVARVVEHALTCVGA